MEIVLTLYSPPVNLILDGNFDEYPGLGPWAPPANNSIITLSSLNPDQLGVSYGALFPQSAATVMDEFPGLPGSVVTLGSLGASSGALDVAIWQSLYLTSGTTYALSFIYTSLYYDNLLYQNLGATTPTDAGSCYISVSYGQTVLLKDTISGIEVGFSDVTAPTSAGESLASTFSSTITGQGPGVALYANFSCSSGPSSGIAIAAFTNFTIYEEWS